MENLKETPLARLHRELGARMVPFAGWSMPVQYPNGILEEHRKTREEAALFDICHMGEFLVEGPEAAAELDRALARPVLDQPVGSCRYNFLLNDQGGILDDLIVYRLSDTEFMLVVNAGCIDGDAAEIQKRLVKSRFEDQSPTTAKLDLQGPGSREIMAKLGYSLTELPGYYHFTRLEIRGIPVLLSRTGYTGELGFEFYVDNAHVETLWTLLTGLGAAPAGLGARDTLRLELGYPLYGHEFTPETTPVEAGFGKMLKLEAMPDRQFTGSRALRSRKPAQSLVGVRLEGRRAARAGDIVKDAGGTPIGAVSSGAFAPSLGYAVALAWVNHPLPDGTPVKLGNAELPALTTPTPFYPDGTARMA